MEQDEEKKDFPPAVEGLVERAKANVLQRAVAKRGGYSIEEMIREGINLALAELSRKPSDDFDASATFEGTQDYIYGAEGAIAEIEARSRPKPSGETGELVKEATRFFQENGYLTQTLFNGVIDALTRLAAEKATVHSWVVTLTEEIDALEASKASLSAENERLRRAKNNAIASRLTASARVEALEATYMPGMTDLMVPPETIPHDLDKGDPLVEQEGSRPMAESEEKAIRSALVNSTARVATLSRPNGPPVEQEGNKDD